MALDVKELCRLCGKKDEFSKDLKDEDNKNTLKLIQEFIQIPFAEHDELPTKVCLNCEEKIESFQLFVLECYNMQETLRQMCLETCEKYPIKLEDDIVDDFNISAIKSEVKHELSAEDLVKDAINSDECVTGFDADDYNNSNDDDDNVTLATLKNSKQEKTSETKRMTETGKNHLEKISDLDTGDFVKFKCNICNIPAKAWSEFRAHSMKIHKRKPELFCVCGFIITSMRNLYRHVSEHRSESTKLKKNNEKTDSDKEKHDKCQRITKTLTAMNKHKKKHTPKSGRKFSCSLCDKVFSSKDTLRVHVRTHIPIEERKIYSCDLCEQKFTTRSNAATHRRVVHDKVRRHVCELCAFSSGSGDTLRRHRATHSDDRPFACRECDKRFKTYSSWKIHEQTHDDKRRHVCSHCNKAFTRRETLKEHSFKHAGVKPLACEWCGVRFSYSSTLYRHRRRRHPGGRPTPNTGHADGRAKGYLKDDTAPPKTDVEAI